MCLRPHVSKLCTLREEDFPIKLLQACVPFTLKLPGKRAAKALPSKVEYYGTSKNEGIADSSNNLFKEVRSYEYSK